LQNAAITMFWPPPALWLRFHLLCICTVCLVCRMSLFFFRLHNLRREEENKRRKKTNSGSSTSTGGGMQQRRSISSGWHRYHGTLPVKPSRLFERTPLTPSDSLDEIALQIPRCHPACLFCLSVFYNLECFYGYFERTFSLFLYVGRWLQSHWLRMNGLEHLGKRCFYRLRKTTRKFLLAYF
jgi:hypothetical protein